MKKIAKLKSVIYLLMALILLMQQFGCSTSKVISASDLKVSPEYLYKIHYRKSVYLLTEPVISNGILSGKSDIDNSTRIKNIIHIYPVSDSMVRINSEKTLSIPLNKISQVKEKDLSKGRTAALVIGSSLAVFIVLVAIAMRDFEITL